MNLDPNLGQDQTLGHALLSHARAAIAERLNTAAPTINEHAALNDMGSTFVTLTMQDELRGCIGQLEATRALRKDVRENALSAAFRDPRFTPLTLDEWPHIRIEVSLIGPISMTSCPSEAACIALLTPFEDGVVLASGCRRSTFLPQVWEKLPSPKEFLLALRQKAGLGGEWPDDMMVGCYRVVKFKERE